MFKDLIKNTAVYGSANVLFSFIAFITFPIFARYLSVKDYGVLSLVETISGFVGMFTALGINNSIQRYYFDAEYGTNRQTTLISTGFWGITIVTLVIVIISGIGFLPFLRLISEKYEIRSPYIYLALATLVPATCLNYFADVFRLKFDPIRFAIVSFFQKLFSVILGLFFVVALGRGLQGNFEGVLVGSLLGVAIGVFFIHKDIRLEYDHSIFKKLLSFGFPFVFASLSMWFFSSTTRWMLANMASVEDSGLYAVAFKMSNIATIVTTAISMAWAPFVFKLFGEDPEYRAKIIEIFETLIFVVTAFCALLCMFSCELLQILTPSVYWKASNPAVILIMSVVFMMSQQVTALGISFEKRTNLISYGWCGIAILNAVLSAVFIPLLAATGGALSNLLCNLLLSAYYLYCTQKLHPFPFSYRRLSWYILSSLIFIIIAISLNQLQSGSILVALKLFILSVYCVTSIKFGIIDKKVVNFVLLRCSGRNN